jgi:hypothetical protein
MWLTTWLRNWMTHRRPSSARKPTRYRPQLESLEGRDVPSTLTVTNTLDSDSAAGSLR